ncbi:hypothetical protein ACQJBY_000019 [Aegilops geniculata]
MDFSGAVQWWDEWQLRVLVLGSLFIQCFLFFSSVVRRCALPSLAQTLHVACLPRRGCSGDIRPGHPLQPPQAAVSRWERPRGPVDTYPPHPPRGPAPDDCLQHRRQRAVDSACHNRGVPAHGGPLRLLHVVVRGEELTAGCNLAVRRWDYQVHPEAMGSEERQYQWHGRLCLPIHAKGTRSGCTFVWTMHFRSWLCFLQNQKTRRSSRREGHSA